jgi:hypothetical protein
LLWRNVVLIGKVVCVCESVAFAMLWLSLCMYVISQQIISNSSCCVYAAQATTKPVLYINSYSHSRCGVLMDYFALGSSIKKLVAYLTTAA